MKKSPNRSTHQPLLHGFRIMLSCLCFVSEICWLWWWVHCEHPNSKCSDPILYHTWPLLSCLFCTVTRKMRANKAKTHFSTVWFVSADIQTDLEPWVGLKEFSVNHIIVTHAQVVFVWYNLYIFSFLTHKIFLNMFYKS